ncbi:MAG: DUF935 family protein [Deltaproteobacteria bacterium]|nr:DUF935 family protein [Deltaproteobacteria bacterium]
MAENQKVLKDEIATAEKDLDIFSGYIKRLENPDPTLRTEAAGKGLKLYDEVDRDPHAGSVLQTRYLAVVGKEWEVLPADDSARAKEIADAVKEILAGTNFDQFRQEILQAILYGFYTAEVLWEVRDNLLVPGKIRAKHPRRFAFDYDRNLRLLTPQSMIDGEPVPDKKFIVFTYGSSDNPYGRGLGQKLWWPVWFKKHGIKFWLVFLEKFGMPTTVGKYPPGTPKEQQQALLDAIEAIHTETGVKIPDTMAIDLLEATRSGKVTYETLCDYMDRQISKAVLGQTLTTEVKGEGSYAASKTHDAVRGDILKADADLLCECLNETLVKWIVDLNFAGAGYPQMWIRTDEEKDLKPLAERDKILAVDIGLPMTKRYFYETYAVGEPEEGEELVEGRKSAPGPDAAPPFTAAFAEVEDLKDEKQAQARVDALADAAIRKALPHFDGIKDRVKAALDQAVSLADAKDRIKALYGDLDREALANAISDAMAAAAEIGEASIATADVGRDFTSRRRHPGYRAATGGRHPSTPSFIEAQWGPGTPFKDALEYFTARAFTISGITHAGILNAVKGEIVKAIEKGMTLKAFKAAVDGIFERHGWDKLAPYRIETIFRTNLQSAYQAGRLRQMTNPAVVAARPYWRYVAVMDPSTRPEHAALHGKVFRNDHPFWDTWYPPNGYNCRCTVQTLSRREMERRGYTEETADPTGALIEPEDPVTGEKLPARPLMPDPGWDKPLDLDGLLKQRLGALYD